jgi:hypothetical protein
MMLLYTIFLLLFTILENWYKGCNTFYALNEQKCHGKPSDEWLANISLLWVTCDAFTNVFYYIGHFLFAYRYFEVAEMFGRDDQSQAKHEKNRSITRRISYVIVALICINWFIECANYGIYRRVTGEYNFTLDKWTYTIMPGVLLLSYCILQLVALVWICRSLKHDPKVMGNEKWMGAHSVLLVMILGSYIYSIFFASGYTSFKIYYVLNTMITLLMAFIMDQVNGSQYIVFSEKFVGKN